MMSVAPVPTLKQSDSFWHMHLHGLMSIRWMSRGEFLIWQHHRKKVCQTASRFEDPAIQTSLMMSAALMACIKPKSMVYVDDIIFGSNHAFRCEGFEELMQKEFKMSSMGELTFFLGLQVKQSNGGIFLSQDKYVKDILNKFDFRTIKPASTPIEAHKLYGRRYRWTLLFTLKLLLTVTILGNESDRRSTSEDAQYLGKKLVSLGNARNQTFVAISSTEQNMKQLQSCFCSGSKRMEIINGGFMNLHRQYTRYRRWHYDSTCWLKEDILSKRVNDKDLDHGRS
ncbi:putative ribonuclease H-like domain-containing protein [Tanacetum coccineum]